MIYTEREGCFETGDIVLDSKRKKENLPVIDR
jgi:hypothetical protein